MDTLKKLQILSEDSQYDLACACGTGKEDRRHRGEDGKWLYPVTLPQGGKSIIFKTLLSNVCKNDCKYCPLRSDTNIRRCTLTPEETVKSLLEYYRRKKVFGMFLSSGVIDNPDFTMEKINTIARILRRKYQFRGYLHLKIIPGADFLMRQYGFRERDFFFENTGNFSMEKDPKQVWADLHPEFFPININTTSKEELLRVPGLGIISIRKILKFRRIHKLESLSDIGLKGKLKEKASKYICY